MTLDGHLFICVFIYRPQTTYRILLMAGPLRPTPPPLELNGHWNFAMFEKKVPKKGIFSLIARPFTPFNGPAIKRRTFFCGFP